MKITTDTSALRNLSARLRGLTDPGRQARLIQDIEDYATASNRIDTMDALDAQGKPLVPWRVRRGKYKGLTGPTMAAHGATSHRIRFFFVRTTRTARGFVTHLGYALPLQMARVFRWHARGRAGTGKKGKTTGIVRDVVSGIPPARVERIRTMIREYFSLGRRSGR